MRVTLAALLLLIAVAVVTSVAVAASAHPRGDVVTKEHPEGPVPHGWTQLSRAAPEREIELTILIAQQNIDELTENLLAVSDPRSSRYGQHLTFAEVNQLVAPRKNDINSVIEWLKSHSIEVTERTMKSTPNRDMITVRMTIVQAESLLHTQYHEYEHESESKVRVLRSQHYKVPSHLVDVIDTIGPAVRFPSTAALRRHEPINPHHIAGNKANPDLARSKDIDQCAAANGWTTPYCLRQLYHINNYTASEDTNSTSACTGFDEQYFHESDLVAFRAQLDPGFSLTPTIIGPNNQSIPAGSEPSLDVQYLMALSPGVPSTFWSVNGNAPGMPEVEPFLVFLQQLASTEDAPLVISSSYGENEDEVVFSYASRVNVEFAKLGARGISLLSSSGDGGVTGGHFGGQSCTTFNPTFPSGSPWVTIVGSTTGFSPETAAKFSSGGFSNYFAMQSYQAEAILNYVNVYGASTLPPTNLWNSSGAARGFPDVSAAGYNYAIRLNGEFVGVSGTSASAPTFSGVIALLNDVRLSAGKSSLGFLNPLLYQNPHMFTDITAGNNGGCNTNGFTAVQYWDAVTGLGTPLFDVMQEVVLNLP